MTLPHGFAQGPQPGLESKFASSLGDLVQTTLYRKADQYFHWFIPRIDTGSQSVEATSDSFDTA